MRASRWSDPAGLPGLEQLRSNVLDCPSTSQFVAPDSSVTHLTVIAPNAASGLSLLVRVAGAVLVLVTAIARPAAAGDDASAADKLIHRGVELRRVHDDDGAQREFQKAYDLVHTPRAAGQLGLAEQALGRWEDAETHLSEAIRAAGDSWVAKNRAVLDQALVTIQAHLGRIEVIGGPEGAAVSLNGRAVGKLPLEQPIRVSAGQVDVEVHATGYLPVQRTVSIVGGQYQRVVIRLAKDETAEPKATIAPRVNATAPAPEPTRAGPTPEPAPASSSTRPILKWTAAGLAGASLATGVVFTVLHSSAVSDFEKSCRILNDTGVDAMGQPSPSCNDKYHTNKREQYAFIASYAAAGVFAATWLILQLTEPTGGSPAEHASRGPACAPSVSGIGVACALRF